MGQIHSAGTIYAVAYLTTYARELLFNNSSRYHSPSTGPIVDKFQITHFSILDPDENYAVSGLLSTGEVPDASGKKDTCIKAIHRATKIKEGMGPLGVVYGDKPTEVIGTHEIVITKAFSMNVSNNKITDARLLEAK